MPVNLTRLDWFGPAVTAQSLSQLEVKGTAMRFEPIPQHEYGLPESFSHLSESYMEVRAIKRHVSSAAWLEAATRVQARRQLHVALLGFSILAGCGSRDHAAPPLKYRCDPAYSWSRRLHDSLQARLAKEPQWSSVHVHTSVYFKNSVGLSFYSHCIGSMLSQDADVVLLEAGSNMFEFSTKDAVLKGLKAVLRSIRKTAPNAVVGFVSYHHPRRSGIDVFLRPLINQSAAAHGIDLFDIGRLQNSLTQKLVNCTASHELLAAFFAKDGSDHHPTRAGHELIGEITAFQITRSLLGAETLNGSAIPQQQNSAPIGHKSRGNSTLEQCFNQANELAVRNASGTWHLADEGGAKGVQKLGWVSTSIGDAIDFMTANLSCPPARKASETCETVRLGFLLATRQEQGTFSVSCIGGGCECSGVYPTEAKYGRGISPFPFVTTDARVAGETSHGNLPMFGTSIAVTATTEFTLKRLTGVPNGNSSTQPCFIRIQHVKKHMAWSRGWISRTARVLNMTLPDFMDADNTEPSRIRVDSLGFRCQPSCAERFFQGYELDRQGSEYDPRGRG